MISWIHKTLFHKRVQLQDDLQSTKRSPLGLETLEDRCVPAVMLSVAGASSLEGEANQATLMRFGVTRSGDLDLGLVIDYQFRDGSALAGVDYLPSTGSITFDPGQTEASIFVSVLGNTAQLDGDRSFTLELTQIGLLGDPRRFSLGLEAEGTIQEDDELLLDATPNLVDEGDIGNTLFTRFISLGASIAPGVTVEIVYTSEGVTATADVDFVSLNDTLTLTSDSTSFDQTIIGAVIGDLEEEPDEIFRVNFTAFRVINREGQAIAYSDPGGFEVIIYDDDRQVTERVASGAVTPLSPTSPSASAAITSLTIDFNSLLNDGGTTPTTASTAPSTVSPTTTITTTVSPALAIAASQASASSTPITFKSSSQPLLFTRSTSSAPSTSVASSSSSSAASGGSNEKESSAKGEHSGTEGTSFFEWLEDWAEQATKKSETGTETSPEEKDQPQASLEKPGKTTHETIKAVDAVFIETSSVPDTTVEAAMIAPVKLEAEEQISMPVTPVMLGTLLSAPALMGLRERKQRRSPGLLLNGAVDE